MASRPSQPFPDSLERFKKHEPKGRDLSLILLKSHLLIEEEMNELLEVLLPHPEFIYRSRFGFLQRLRVLQAVTTDNRLHALADAMEILNEMRNSLAHQLEPTKPRQLAPAFIDAAFNSAMKKPRPREAVSRQVALPKAQFSLVALKQAIAIVIGTLAFMKTKHGSTAA